MPVHICTYVHTNQPTNQPINQSINQFPATNNWQLWQM